MSIPPTVRFGDGTECALPPTVLEELGALVVYAGRAGRAYGDDRSLRRREVETDEKVASIRADLQRMLRDGQAGLTNSAQMSAWPEVREFARKTASELKSTVEHWQEQTKAGGERARKNLAQHQHDVAAAMRADLFAYVRACVTRRADVTLVRRLSNEGYVDLLRYEAARGLRVLLRVDHQPPAPAQRVRALVKGTTLQAGVRKSLFGREKPRMLRLDPYYVVESVVGPNAIDLRLAPKLEAHSKAILLRLRRSGDRIEGQLTLDEGQRVEAAGDDALRGLWDALQQGRRRATGQPTSVREVQLDDCVVADAAHVFDCAQRLIERWRPIVTQLSEHTPGPDELCVLVSRSDGPDDELWVRTADLTQHLLTIPMSIRGHLAPVELLGPAEVTRESDVINLGKAMVPDAGDDSDVISLHYIPPQQRAQQGAVEAGAPGPVVELSTSDISVLDLARDPVENSGCYDLARLGRTASS